MLSTPKGRWLMPPQRGMWIPPNTLHEVQMVGAVTTHSVYLHPTIALDMPRNCQVVDISPLIRSLIDKALDLPLDYESEGHASAVMTLLRYELRQLPELPFSLPLPTTKVLAEACRAFLLRPSATETVDSWAKDVGMSRRAFTRNFRRETGLSFVTWRQQACLMTALPRLMANESITTIALDLGYENPAAFTTMFKRVLGIAPRTYIRDLSPKGRPAAV